MPAVLKILFGALWTLATAWALGQILLRRVLPLELKRQEEPLFALLTGSALLSLALFAMGMLGLYRDWAFLALGLLAAAAVARTGAWRPSGESFPPLPALWRGGFALLFLVYAVLGIAYAMAPETSPDGASYHLGIVSRYYRAHRMLPMPDHMYGQLPQGADLLAMMAFAFGRHSAGALQHAGFWLALPLLILRFGQRFGDARGALAAAFLVFVTPVVMIDGCTAYNDVALTAVLFGIVYLGEIYRENGGWRVALLLGLLAGFAYSIKYTAAVGGLYALTVVLLRPGRARAFTAVAAGGLFVALPWLVRNALWYQNPFAPLMTALFPNPFIHRVFEQEYAELMRFYVGIKSYGDALRQLLLGGPILAGFLGPVWALTPLALLSLRRPIGRRLLFAAVFLLAPFAFNMGARFLIPALPVLALAIVFGLRRPGAAVLLALAQAVLCFPSVVGLYTDGFVWRVHEFRWRQALRLEKENDFLTRAMPDYGVAQQIDRLARPGDTVFALSGLAESYTQRPIRTAYMSARNETLRDRLWSALIWDWQRNARQEFRFPPQKLRSVRVVQTAPPSPELWGLYEFRVMRNGREVPRSPQWRYRTSTNPWELHFAFDNSPYTRWRAWQRAGPGMFIELDFGAEIEIDAVALETSRENYRLAFRCEGPREVTGPVEIGLAPPFGMRRKAIEALKAEGITHLLVGGGEFYGEDYHTNRDLWGITLLNDTGGVRLYRLD